LLNDELDGVCITLTCSNIISKLNRDGSFK